MGLYAILLALPLLSLVSLCFRVTSRRKASLLFASQHAHLEHAYLQFQKRQRVHSILALVAFTLVSLFLCLYLMGFCTMANAAAQRDWLTSSGISLALDMALF